MTRVSPIDTPLPTEPSKAAQGVDEVLLKRPGGYDVTPEASKKHESEEVRGKYRKQDEAILQAAAGEKRLTPGTGETPEPEAQAEGTGGTPASPSQKGNSKTARGQKEEKHPLTELADRFAAAAAAAIISVLNLIATFFNLLSRAIGGGGKKGPGKGKEGNESGMERGLDGQSPEEIAKQQIAQFFTGLKSLLGLDQERGQKLEEKLPVAIGATALPEANIEEQAQVGTEMLAGVMGDQGDEEEVEGQEGQEAAQQEGKAGAAKPAIRLDADSMSLLASAVGLNRDQLETLQAVLSDHGVQCDIGERDEPEANRGEEAEVAAAIAAVAEAEAEAEKKETEDAIAAVADAENIGGQRDAENQARTLAAAFAHSPDAAGLEGVEVSEMEEGEAAQGTSATSEEAQESRDNEGRS